MRGNPHAGGKIKPNRGIQSIGFTLAMSRNRGDVKVSKIPIQPPFTFFIANNKTVTLIRILIAFEYFRGNTPYINKIDVHGGLTKPGTLFGLAIFKAIGLKNVFQSFYTL